MMLCRKCGCEIDEMEGVCHGCLSEPTVRSSACSAADDWFHRSQWAGAGKDAGELARAAWYAAMEHAANLTNRHRQELFDDGLEVDLDEMDKKAIFLESMVQERDSIEDMLRAEAKPPNGKLTDAGPKTL